MAVILCIETATGVCSVSLLRDDIILGTRESSARNVHSAMLTVFIEELMKSCGYNFAGLDAVAVSMGPGSYTGLRIGVATAKGLCYALGKPLIAVPTLQAMAAGMTRSLLPPDPGGIEKHTLVCPMIDARRMEVYCAVYDMAGTCMREASAEIVDGDSFADLLENNIVVLGGDGSEKCRDLLAGCPNARFMADFRTSARFMHHQAVKRFRENNFEDLAYFEPFYLKDFVAGKARVKGLK